ncbi:hypothetical protein [Haloimpatiens lingqiaonensis]|uniref:hypothetical protein n=1 Tax=Haloimpatiens lingqiaonensis TaxID=1380675 RepID=UPI0010FE1C6F|nr:hypothetical protein [Haloimpatiens lingqiaonensis]
MTFLVILLLLSLGANGYFILTFSKKSDTLKKQSILLSRQNDTLRSKLIELYPKKPSSISYNIPKYKWGIIQKNSTLFISPLENSIELMSFKENTKVYILDNAKVDLKNWFYICFDSPDNITIKGWVKEESISLINEIL